MNENVTTALLIRHAHTDAIGQRLSGRAPDVPLSNAGRAQAERLGRALSACELAAIYSSPLERAVETARAVALRQSAPVHVVDELNEIDFGAWTGKTFAELESTAEWRRFNESRSQAPVPGGERALDVQRRIVRVVAQSAERHAGGVFAVISHGDVLRYAVQHYAATPLDMYDRFEISPASVTVVELSAAGPRLRSVNNRIDGSPLAI